MNNELYHYGVKGMKWKKHKYKSKANGEYIYDDIIPDKIERDTIIPDKIERDTIIPDKIERDTIIPDKKITDRPGSKRNASKKSSYIKDVIKYNTSGKGRKDLARAESWQKTADDYRRQERFAKDAIKYNSENFTTYKNKKLNRDSIKRERRLEWYNRKLATNAQNYANEYMRRYKKYSLKGIASTTLNNGKFKTKKALKRLMGK